jgi:hypothetical protein
MNMSSDIHKDRRYLDREMHLKFRIYVLASVVLMAMKKLHSTVFTSLGWALTRRKSTGAPGMPPSAQRSYVSATFVQEGNIAG